MLNGHSRARVESRRATVDISLPPLPRRDSLRVDGCSTLRFCRVIALDLNGAGDEALGNRRIAAM